ncbi:MAG: HAMP domain-containing sensor histidine kinase [Eubacteriales bacterium]|nr:HAMP domain-containing sensor histidine kinase [Christensenellaceae bacterium]MEA5067263.1 HAMP domain-containing sensor histidine kinase [Eubacteriales bacterium]
MSFRSKLLLCVLLLVTITLDACLLLAVRQSTQLNLDRERARALASHYDLIRSASGHLHSLPDSADAMNTLPLVHNLLVRNLAGARLSWYVDGLPALNDAPASVPEELLEADGLRRTVVSGGWLYAASSLPTPYQNITLLSATSLLPLMERNRQLTQQMLIMAMAASALLLLLSWVLLSGLLAPVARLSGAMRRAMDGDFSVRVKVKGNGELAQLSRGFNRMAHTTEQHIAELYESVQRSQRFADNLAHEMRTPVTSIGGCARLLLEQPLEEADQRRALKYIATESIRMQKMSEALLTLAGIRQDGIRLEPAPVSLLLEHVAQATAPELDQKHLRLCVTCQLDNLICDAALIEALLINLIVNSVRASEPNGQIKLSAGIHHGAACLTVSDRGRGMTEEQANHATEPFYRTDRARSREHGGAGLGLALVNQIAQAHGATLHIESAPGSGTTVRVEFTAHLQPCEDAVTPNPLNLNHRKGMRQT